MEKLVQSEADEMFDNFNSRGIPLKFMYKPHLFSNVQFIFIKTSQHVSE